MLPLIGKVNFEPIPLIPSHIGHKTIILDIVSGYEGMYRWFIKKELGLNLMRPVREGHITIVSWYESGSIDPEIWNKSKDEWGGKSIDVWFHPPKSDAGVPYWWLPIVEEARVPLHALRKNLGLSERPKSGLHLTVGNVSKHEQELSNSFCIL